MDTTIPDLFGGSIPVTLAYASTTVQGAWKFLTKKAKAGWMMCTTCENSGNGLIGTHLYTLEGVQEVQGVRLVKLHNPHGDGGKEWNGKWSDNDSSWTPSMKAAVG